MNILLFGAPGAGKGTQAGCLKSRLNFTHISTGDLFRQAIKNKTALGLKAKTYMDQGLLVPDKITIGLIREKLSSSFKKIIWDGFPRTLVQAKALDKLLSDLSLKMNKVLYLDVPESVLLERLTGRRVAEKSGRVYHIRFCPPKREGFCNDTGEKLVHREDDTQKVVEQRIKTYKEQTAPLLEYYKNILINIPAMESPEEIFKRLQKALLPKDLKKKIFY